ncbi:DNA repair exonuclease [Macrococcus hajekii]|uniref:DNA repair exonuclease n=1 Tax=Macrococcus hajekii TaxID=198482 RepID=A0A4R6BLD0_9STAP|nr:DNA repair exonuclease [Macrococcus hajekii]TDM02576.1 DNA repair exonuclease [Macrococcus hajekii]GGB02095.1 DNA repair exonuclease [Macrococcus hajekii]
MIKFIHCADLYLDAPFQLNGYVSESIMSDICRASFESFSKLIKDAIMQQVDFVLIASNVLSKDNQTLKTIVYLKKQFQRLKDAGIYVYMILGEMDDQLRTVQWPDNVIIFNNQVESYQFITKEGDTVYIHGVSQGHALEYFPTNQVDTSIHIGMLNGRLGDADLHQEALNQKLYHYWALGGSVQRQLVSELPHIHYPGNIQGFEADQTGRKGYLMVEGNHIEMKVVFVPTQHIKFGQSELVVEDRTKNGLLKLIEDFKNEQRAEGKSIYQLTLINEDEQLLNMMLVDQVLKLAQQHEVHENHFVWVDKMMIEQNDMTTLHREFDKDMLADRSLFERAVQPLYHHADMNRFLDSYEDLSSSDLIQTGEIKLKARMQSDEN